MKTQKILDVDLSKVLDSIGKYSPFVARQLVIKYANLASPFNAHLKGDLQVWTDKKTKIKIGHHRGVKNHLGGVHAGALFTLGEMCAGLLLLKNFNPLKFRLILQSASVDYSKQGRTAVVGTSELSVEKLKRVKAAVKAKRKFSIPMETEIQNLAGEALCLVKTKWQIKPWEQVRKKRLF